MLVWQLPASLDFFYRPRGDLMPLFLSGIGRKVAVALLTLFSPIYIYQVARSFEIEQKPATILVLLYFVALLLVKLITVIISEDLSQKIGFKRTIWVSSIPFLIFIPSLIFARLWPYLFVLAAIFWGIHAGLFWWGYHGYFIKTGKKERFGQRIGEARFLETAAVVLTPFVGALITSYLGFAALFIFSAVFMAISLLFLGKEHEKRQKRDILFSDVLKLMPSHKSISLAYIGSQAEWIIYVVVWPLFLFLFFGQIIKLGAIVSIASLLAAFFAIVFGKWIDRRGEKMIVSLGAPLVALSWILKIIRKNLPIFVIADSIENFGQRMVNLPLNTLTYRKALEAESAKAILFRETALIIGSVSSLLILAGWVSFGGDLSGSFIIAAVFGLLPMVAVARKRLPDYNSLKNG
jgi:MFS family permease